MLMGDNNKKNNKNAIKNIITGEFKLSNFNMDEDFPPLTKNSK